MQINHIAATTAVPSPWLRDPARIAMVKTPNATAYGDLEILDPESDLSFDDGSTKFSWTGENESSKSPRRQGSVGNNTSFFKADFDAMLPHITEEEQRVPEKTFDPATTKSVSSSSDASPKRFPVRLFSRPKASSFDAAVKPRDSFLKRKAGPWLRTRQGSKDKRIRYHSFSNDGFDDEDYLLISTQDVNNIVGDYGIQDEVETTQVESKSSSLLKKGAYDNRPIHNTLFHGNEHDHSFHRERKLGEPLLKFETVQQISTLKEDNRDPQTTIDDRIIQWPPLDSEMRNVSTPIREDISQSSPPSSAEFSFNPFALEQDQPAANLSPFAALDSHKTSSSRSVLPLDAKTPAKKSFFANLGCIPKRRGRRSRSWRKNNSPATAERETATQKWVPKKMRTNDVTGASKDQEIAKTMSRSHSRQSFLDDETFEKESRQLDMLANEFQRESPQFLTMPLPSHLSAITEVEEDLTQRSSSLSAHSNIELSGHLRYVALDPMLDDDGSRHTAEEPNLFIHVQFPPKESESATPVHVERAQPEVTEKEGLPDSKEHKRARNDDGANKYLSKDRRKGEKQFHLKGEEITLSSNSDEDSSGGVSDITEEFIHFPITSPLFKKAMDLFRGAEEDEIENEPIEESRDDLDELQPMAQLHI